MFKMYKIDGESKEKTYFSHILLISYPTDTQMLSLERQNFPLFIQRFMATYKYLLEIGQNQAFTGEMHQSI